MQSVTLAEATRGHRWRCDIGGRGNATDRGSSKFGGGTAGGGGATLEGYGTAERALARKIFGKNVSDKDIVTMAGAGGFTGKVTVEIGIRDGKLQVDIDHKLVGKDGITQTFYRDKGGAKIYMDSYFLKPEAQGKGIGGKSLYLQKEAAIRNGVKEINLYALRDGTKAFGHRAWADVGFEAKLTNTQKDNWQRANPLDALRGVKPPTTVRGLYERAGGREFWSRHAEGLTAMHMKLNRGSKSVKVLDAYAMKKGWRK